MPVAWLVGTAGGIGLCLGAHEALATHSFTQAHRLLDGFDDGFVNPFFWKEPTAGTETGAATVAETGGRLTIEIPSLPSGGAGPRVGALEGACTIAQPATQVDWTVAYDLAEWPAGSGARVALGVGTVLSVARVRGVTQDTLVITANGMVVTTQTLSATAPKTGCLALRLLRFGTSWGHVLGSTSCKAVTSILGAFSGSVRVEASVPGTTTATVRVHFDAFTQAGTAAAGPQVPCGACAGGEVGVAKSWRAPEDPRTCGSSWHVGTDGGSTVTTAPGPPAVLSIAGGEAVVHGRQPALSRADQYGFVALLSQTLPSPATTCDLTPFSWHTVDDGERLVTLRLRGASPCTGSGLSLALVSSPTASPGSALAAVAHVGAPAGYAATAPAVHAVWVERGAAGGIVRLFSGESLETRAAVPYASFVAAGEAVLPAGVRAHGLAFGAQNATASWQTVTVHACEAPPAGGDVAGPCDVESLPAEPPGFTGDVYFNAFEAGGEIVRMPLAAGVIAGPTECVARVPKGDNIVFLPDGRLAIGGSTTGYVYVIDPTTPSCAVVQTTTVNATPLPVVAGTSSADFLAVSPDGKRLYTTNQYLNDRLHAIDLATGAVLTMLFPSTPSIKVVHRTSGIVFPAGDVHRLLMADGRSVGDFSGLFELILSGDLATITSRPAIGLGVDYLRDDGVTVTQAGARGLTFDPWTGHAFSCSYASVLEWNPLGPGVRSPLCVMESGGLYCDGMRSDGRGHLFLAHDGGELTMLDLWKPCGCRTPTLLFDGIELDGVELVSEEAGAHCPGEVGP